MSISPNKRLAILVGVICLGLLVLYGCLYWNYAMLKLRVEFARDQTQIFEDMRKQALQSDADGAAGCLGYIINYYPSGSKQETGSRLDRIVERDRALALRDVIKYLRVKTGQDLGENPEAWIKKYGKN